MALFRKKTNQWRQVIDQFEEDIVGFLEPGVEFEGKVKVVPNSGLVRVNTHFKGEIDCEGKIVVADQGEVEADIHTKTISISGKVKGTIHASERLEIKEHGIVLGDIYTPCLVIEPGGYFDGQCHMPTPEPEKHAAHDRGPNERP